MDSDQHLAQFRAQSDQAFLAMQTRADQEMEKFLHSYSEGATLASFRTPEMSWNTAPPLALPAAAVTAVRRKARQTAEKLDQATGGKLTKARGAAGRAAHQAFNEFGELGASVKKEMQAHAHDASSDVANVLRGATMDLGERAKREAAAMREAARKAMAEETSLRGLAERAKKELNAAKERVQHELLDAQADTLAELEGVAVQKIEELSEQGLGAAEATGGRYAQRLDELLGPDSQPPRR